MAFSHNLVPFLSYSVDWIAELNPVQMNYPIKLRVVVTIIGLEGHRQTLVWPDLEHMSSFIREIPFGVDYIVILPKLKMNHLITHHLFTTPLLYWRKIQVTYEIIETSVKGKRWSFIQYICAIEHVKQEKC